MSREPTRSLVRFASNPFAIIGRLTAPRRAASPLTALALTGLLALCGSVALATASPAAAQQTREVVRVEAEPSALELTVGETVELAVRAYDADGREVPARFRYAAPRSALDVDDGRITGVEAGLHELVVSIFPEPGITWPGEEPPSVRVPVGVDWPAIVSVEVRTVADGWLYEGTMLRHEAIAYHADGTRRPDPVVRWTSSDPEVATVDRRGNVTARAAGPVEIIAEAGGVRGTLHHSVRPLSGHRIEVTGGADEARTGDVLRYEARVLDAAGTELPNVPIEWTHTYRRGDDRGARGVAGGMVVDGRFVAEMPGEHHVIATAGSASGRAVVEIEERDAVRRLEVVGHGRVSHTRTTDFWVFEGVDGRDYAITGSKDVGGQAYVWDVTDPSNIVLTDSVQVDARSVNDVKVSPDARYASLTREGASDRRNGVVILDLSNPAHPTVAAHHTDGLTGGVHNSFPTNDHLFALSGGEKYVIIDVTDIYNPRNVGEFGLDDARIHDVWVRDGIAYSAQRPYGSIIVDVGNGAWGGSPENPVLIGTTGPMPEGGGFHAIFPYESPSADKFYLFAGDEIMNRRGRALEGTAPGGAYRRRYDPETGEGGVPAHTAGYMHIVDFTDPDNPAKVARYYVPEYGTHNVWVEDDIMYQAYYEGGLRIVDVSGELMGDLYRQGREIAVFKPYDPEGYVSNAPLVWSAMPHKGHIFLTDTNSGLWAVKLESDEPVLP